MPLVSTGAHDRPKIEADSASEPVPGWRCLLSTLLWFGFATGWLELGLLFLRRALDPRVTDDMVRLNRHYVWMVPASDVLIFTVVSLLMIPLARVWPRFIRWLSMRLALALSALALLLLIEGIYLISSMILACGLATVIGTWLDSRAQGLRRVVRVSLPVMALSLIGLTGLMYERVNSAERRALSQTPVAKPGTPNVLLIVLDDVRAASLSLYGHRRPTTPNLERWARKGLLFSEARSTAPWTLPTHASMLTGRWPHELSVGWDRPLDRTFPTLAEVLGRQGYATAGFVGNTYYCNAAFGLDRGFARYEDAYENLAVSLFETVRSSSLGQRVTKALSPPTWGADWFTSVRKTAEMINRDVFHWLAGCPSGQPFFVFVNYYDAHAPFLPPDGPDPHFGTASLPVAERLEIDRRFVAWSEGKHASSEFAPAKIESDAIDVYRDSYESSIAYLDRQVGLLLDGIERRGLLDNTLVIVTSDHGEHFGEHGLLGHGLSLYRDEVHVPLLILPPSRSPLASSAKVVNEPVSLREIPATVVEWVDSGQPSPFQGRSLNRFLSDDADRPLESSPILCEVQHLTRLSQTAQIPSTNGPVTALLARKRVYIRGVDGREEFYDLANDPIESDNLAEVPESRRELDQFREELGRLYPKASSPVGK